jgi:formate-dependent nitrite reductase membrane component NrfD
VSEQGDGRNVDPSLGWMQGEAAGQIAPRRRAEGEGAPPFTVWQAPTPTQADGQTLTYYERPILKQPVWKWYVPAYFFCGGLSGASAALGAVAHAADREGLDGLIVRARWVAAIAGAAGTVLLIADLGKPDRFLNMLRVFRPTSPMNLGSWVVAAEGPLAAGSALLGGSNEGLGRAADAAGAGAGALGSLMTGYTAVLLSNTAVPVWQQIRRTLPPLFVASSISGAASVLALFRLSDGEASVARRFALAGLAGELIASVAVEGDAGRVAEVARPLHEGVAGSLWKAAKLLTATGLAVTLLSRRSRPLRMLAGVLGTAGAVALRFAVAEAGKQSAADPHATLAQQRAGLGGAEAIRTG